MLDSVDLKGLNPVAFVKKEECGNCRFHAREDADVVCRFDPPKVFMFPMPTKTQMPGLAPQQAVALQTFSSFPQVRKDGWCGKWVGK